MEDYPIMTADLLRRAHDKLDDEAGRSGEEGLRAGIELNTDEGREAIVEFVIDQTRRMVATAGERDKPHEMMMAAVFGGLLIGFHAGVDAEREAARHAV